jgi:hypothetical protein
MRVIEGVREIGYRTKRLPVSSVVSKIHGAIILLIGGIALIVQGTFPQICKPVGYVGKVNATAAFGGFDPELLYNTECWWYPLSGFITWCAFTAFYVFFRIFPLACIIFLACTFCGIIPMIIVYPLDGPFEYIKLFSVTGALIVVILFRLDHKFKYQSFHKLGPYAPENEDKPWSKLSRTVAKLMKAEHFDSNIWRWFLYFALAINIGEAVVFDMLDGNYANGVAGIILVIAQPRCQLFKWDKQVFWFTHIREKFIDVGFVDNDARPGYWDFVYETDWFWVLAYTTWNLCFSYLERKEHFATICVVLTTALFGSADPLRPSTFLHLDPHLYAQTRTATLTMRYMVLSFFDAYEYFNDSTLYASKQFAFGWGIANCLIWIPYMIVRWFYPHHGYIEIEADRERKKQPDTTAAIIDAISDSAVTNGPDESAVISAPDPIDSKPETKPDTNEPYESAVISAPDSIDSNSEMKPDT